MKPSSMRRSFVRLYALLALSVVGVAGPARAETGPGFSVYPITVGPGSAVWERFGHNALWLYSPEAGIDIAYNYGVFDFQQGDVVSRSLQGRMFYSLRPFPGTRMVEGDAWAGTAVPARTAPSASVVVRARKRSMRAFP